MKIVSLLIVYCTLALGKLAPVKELGLVHIFITPDCPVAIDAHPDLCRALADDRFQWKVFVSGENRRAEDRLTTYRSLGAQIIMDPLAREATKEGFDRVPSVSVRSLDSSLIYRGALSSRRQPDGRTRFFLGDVIEAVASGNVPEIRDRPVEGCLLPAAPDQSIKPLRSATNLGQAIKRACLPCHRTGGHAPFPLESTSQVQAWAPMIREVISKQKMPPLPSTFGAKPAHASVILDAANIALWVSRAEELMFENMAFQAPHAARPVPTLVVYPAGPGVVEGNLTRHRSRRYVKGVFTNLSGVRLLEPVRRDLRAIRLWLLRSGTRVAFIGDWLPGQTNPTFALDSAVRAEPGDVFEAEFWLRSGWTGSTEGIKLEIVRTTVSTPRVRKLITGLNGEDQLTYQKKLGERLEGIVFPSSSYPVVGTLRNLNGASSLVTIQPPNWPMVQDLAFWESGNDSVQVNQAIRGFDDALHVPISVKPSAQWQIMLVTSVPSAL